MEFNLQYLYFLAVELKFVNILWNSWRVNEDVLHNVSTIETLRTMLKRYNHSKKLRKVKKLRTTKCSKQHRKFVNPVRCVTQPTSGGYQSRKEIHYDSSSSKLNTMV
ncbi:hypothetical protein QL285_078886 [Trifolium repens]|nr:hypothetical protein QL285_078886 [Trifolium repens]